MVLPVYPAKAQDFVYYDKEIRDVIKAGLDKSYNFEFDAAEKIYQEVRIKYPRNPAYNFLMAMNCYWKMFYFNNYKEKSSEYIDLLEKALDQTEELAEKSKNNPEAIFFFLAIHSSFALYHVQNKENFKAITSAKKTYDYIREGYPLKEKYTELYFSAGIYDFYREQYPETHPGYKSVLWMFAPGSKEKGIEELEIATRTTVFSQTEARYFLVLILLKYQNVAALALPHAEYLIKKFPKNTNFLMRYTEALILNGNYEEAEKYAYHLNKQNQKIFQMVSFVFFGIIYEKHKLKPDQAKAYYLKSLKLSTEVDFPVNDYTGFAYAGLARIAASKGDIAQAKMYYEKALDASEYNTLVQEAERFLKK